MSNKKTEYTPAEVKHRITHDFVLEMYEKALDEKDEEVREALMETVKVLSQNIDTYLVSTTNDHFDNKKK